MALYHGIYINSDNLKNIADQLKSKINEIEKNYNSITSYMKEIDGTNDNWQGNDQKIFYGALESLTSRYEANMDKLNEIYDFLMKVIDDYETRDENFGRDLDRNADNLDM